MNFVIVFMYHQRHTPLVPCQPKKAALERGSAPHLPWSHCAGSPRHIWSVLGVLHCSNNRTGKQQPAQPRSDTAGRHCVGGSSRPWRHPPPPGGAHALWRAAAGVSEHGTGSMEPHISNRSSGQAKVAHGGRRHNVRLWESFPGWASWTSLRCWSALSFSQGWASGCRPGYIQDNAPARSLWPMPLLCIPYKNCAYKEAGQVPQRHASKWDI